jgi:hypothetical protein
MKTKKRGEKMKKEIKIFQKTYDLENILKRLGDIDREMMKNADMKHLTSYKMLVQLIVDLKGMEKNIKIEKKPNNVFCKEKCIKCNRTFDADLNYIYETKLGYICYDCAERKIIGFLGLNCECGVCEFYELPEGYRCVNCGKYLATYVNKGKK